MADLVDIYDAPPERDRAVVRPAIRLRTTGVTLDEIPLGASRIGGCPDLPPSFDWPKYGGVHQGFIAQIHLDEVTTLRPVLPLPSTGHLYFFYGTQQEWGYDPEHRGSAAVIYANAPVEELSWTPIPEDVDESCLFSPCSLQKEFTPSLPPYFGPWYELPPDYDDASALNELGEAFSQEVREGPVHLLGGYPLPVQGEVEVQAQTATNSLYYKDKPAKTMKQELAMEELMAVRARDWKLLLQIDTDDTPSMMWGDMGRIYYLVREKDLVAHDFSNPWLVLQCS